MSESALCRWLQQFIERAPKIFENGSSAVSAEAQRISDLERLVGKLTLELEASLGADAPSILCSCFSKA